MGKENEKQEVVNKCDLCDHETETCLKIHGSGNNVVCVDVTKMSEDEIKEVYDRSVDNANIIYSSIMSLTKHLGIESESELLVTVALTMKSLVEVISNGNDEKYRAIMRHIGTAFNKYSII